MVSSDLVEQPPEPRTDQGNAGDRTETSCDTGITETTQAWRWCPRCSHELVNHRCKLVCPRCHYFMSCSDFD